MLLDIREAKKLKYIIQDKSGKSYFLYIDNGQATRADLEYAIDLHEDYTYVFGKPFIGNIEDLKARVDAMFNDPPISGGRSTNMKCGEHQQRKW